MRDAQSEVIVRPYLTNVILIVRAIGPWLLADTDSSSRDINIVLLLIQTHGAHNRLGFRICRCPYALYRDGCQCDWKFIKVRLSRSLGSLLLLFISPPQP